MKIVVCGNPVAGVWRRPIMKSGYQSMSWLHGFAVQLPRRRMLWVVWR